MKAATVRQIQHHLSDVLKKVEDGEEVLITKRGRAIAKIVPARNQREPINWPDFIGRSRQIWPNRVKGKSISSIIIEERKDRV
ncbi:MAG: type II toxin-antitoxin system prevent-host-death family antitoxin [Acidobacteria bacterium]|nr:type II toxin-antitoxin system prevent-host-death family antitoxin [Acidobacteriota bacterium]